MGYAAIGRARKGGFCPPRSMEDRRPGDGRGNSRRWVPQGLGPAGGTREQARCRTAEAALGECPGSGRAGRTVGRRAWARARANFGALHLAHYEERRMAPLDCRFYPAGGTSAGRHALAGASGRTPAKPGRVSRRRRVDSAYPPGIADGGDYLTRAWPRRRGRRRCWRRGRSGRGAPNSRPRLPLRIDFTDPENAKNRLNKIQAGKKGALASRYDALSGFFTLDPSRKGARERPSSPAIG